MATATILAPIWTCPSRKIPYTLDEATRVVRTIRNKGRQQWKYRCRHCLAYHTTSWAQR